MRAPLFWWRRTPSVFANLLKPVGLLYGAAAGHRMRQEGARAPCPVLCIGNFTMGGAGKTPTALAIAALLARQGEKPFFLSRGYGGRLAGPVAVEPHHRAEDIGDEPLLLARAAPTIVARDRPAGARLAFARGASAIVMDDGLQNPSLKKDFTLAVVDGATGIGNSLCFPSGPLRAPMSTQWSFVDVILIVGEGEAGESVATEAKEHGKPAFRGRLMPDVNSAERFRGTRVIAFAGIGRPDKFFESLRACGATLEEAHSFPDHHVYQARELSKLTARAKQSGALLVTTEKDLVRIGPLHNALDAEIVSLAVSLQIKNQDALLSLVLAGLEGRRMS